MRLLRTTSLLEILGLTERVRATSIGDQVYLRGAQAESDLSNALDTLRGVVTTGGRPVFKIEVREEGGAYLRLRPLLRMDTPIRLGSREVPLSAIVDPWGRISGVHTDKAILLVEGPDIARGHRLAGGTLLDVTPTVLAVLGLPIARDMEGRVLHGVLGPGAGARFPLRYVETYGVPERAISGGSDLDEATREKLRGLGYLR
jgi:hypothetical protein